MIEVIICSDGSYSIYDDDEYVPFEELDSAIRWQIIDRIEKIKEELIKIHKASW